MSLRSSLIFLLTTGVILIAQNSGSVHAQEKTVTAKAYRCTFPLIATGTWKKEGSPDAVVKASSLILRFESVNVDEGTAELKNGTVSSGITVQSAGGNLHFV